MSFELPPLNQFLRPLENQRRSVLDNVATVSDLKITGAVTAVVKATAPVNQQQLDALLAQFQSNSKTNPELKQLLQSNTLKLVQLELENKALLTFTSKAVQAGDKIELYQQSGQLHFRTFAKPDNSQANLQQLRLTEMARTLENALRQSMPLQQPLGRLLNQVSLQTDNAVVKNLVPANAGSQNSSATELLAAIRSLLDSAKTPQQLSLPSQLQQQVRNSGVFLEQKLAALAKNDAQLQALRTMASQASATKSSSRLTDFFAGNANVARALSKMLSQKTNSAVADQRTSANISKSALLSTAKPTTDTNNSVNSDIKYLLSKASEILRDHLKNTLGSEFAKTNGLQFINSGKNTADSSLDKLLQQLFKPHGTNPQQENTQSRSNDNIARLLQHFSAALARIQLHQANSASSTNAQNEAIIQQFSVDLPIKHGNEFHNLELEFREEWLQDKDDEKEETEKTKQWSVLLNFDLPDAGTLFSRVRLWQDKTQDNKVSVQFWTERLDIQTEIQSKLALLQQQLSKKGVNVEEIQCLGGTPPSRNTQLNYALVDVKT